jgi:Aspartyl protease/Tetratricopeptide repeat
MAVLAGVLLCARPGHGDSCHVAQPHTPSAAEQALLAGDYGKAAELYRADLAAKPSDAELTAALARVLLRQQKLDDAKNAVEAGLAAKPESKTAQAVLYTAQAEVRYREGLPWDAVNSLDAASKADPCLGRLHLVSARLAGLSSYYALERQEILLAHQLDPYDPDIRAAWIDTLPLEQRIHETETDLAAAQGKEKDEIARELDAMKRQQKEPHGACRMVSQKTSTQVPFAVLRYDAEHVRGYGLEVKLNSHGSRLQIDTGASGIVISHHIAQQAGIQSSYGITVGGVGDEGARAGYLGFAKSIQVGGMQFEDCAVTVVDDRRMGDLDIDGLIGMDVFSNFEITLDYPMGKFSLSPLPKRPGEAVSALQLQTNSEEGSRGEIQEVPHNRYVAPEMKSYTPVYRVGHNLLVPVSLNQSRQRLFIMDTGAWATSVSPQAAREVAKVHRDISDTVKGLSGEVKRLYYVDKMQFVFARTAQEIGNVASLDMTETSRDIGLETAGFLGATTLQYMTLHLDYRDGLVKFDFDPNKVRHTEATPW